MYQRVQGEFTDCIDLRDRGFQYGDGVFTTIRLQDGIPLYLDYHLPRIARDCQRLGIVCPAAALLEEDIRVLIERHQQRDGVIKIIITRGLGGRGYSPPDEIIPTRVVGLYPPASCPDDYYRLGINVGYCRTALGVNPQLAGIKHMNRLEQILGRMELKSRNLAEGLMLDCEGNLIEGTMTNVFLVVDGVLVTPLLDRCGVRGVMRSILIEGAASCGLSVSEKRVTTSDADKADELFLTNSIVGIWPVRQIEQRILDIGPVTRELTEWLKNKTAEALEMEKAYH